MWRFALIFLIRLQFKRGHAPLIINYLIRVWQGHLGDNRCVYIYLCASLSNYLSFCNIADYFLTFWREEVLILLGKCMYKLSAFEVIFLVTLPSYLSEDTPPLLPAKGKISFQLFPPFCQYKKTTKIRMYKIYVILLSLLIFIVFCNRKQIYPGKYQENTSCMQYSTSSFNPTSEYVTKRLWMWIFYSYYKYFIFQVKMDMYYHRQSLCEWDKSPAHIRLNTRHKAGGRTFGSRSHLHICDVVHTLNTLDGVRVRRVVWWALIPSIYIFASFASFLYCLSSFNAFPMNVLKGNYLKTVKDTQNPTTL